MLKYLVAISQFPKIGPKRYQLLRNYFQTPTNIWNANLSELKHAGLEENLASEFALARNEIDPDAEMEKLSKENIQAIGADDEKYPKLLKEIYSAPFILYYKGNLNNLHEQAIAVVGTRRVSYYGKVVTPQIVTELLNQDLIVVSGLALGVDGLAHLTAVKNKKTTIAVLGSGLDAENIYPSSHRRLAEDIINNNGLIMSEYPIGMMALKQNFPSRNRIISGLSLGTLVIEADEKSGSLITAQFALEQNREVFAIPGPITSPLSIGTNNLIKKGAKPVTCVEDILEELNLKQIKTFRSNREIIPDSPEEATILKHLIDEPRHINELAQMTALAMTEINATLMKLEMKGKVRNLGNMMYVINK